MLSVLVDVETAQHQRRLVRLERMDGQAQPEAAVERGALLGQALHRAQTPGAPAALADAWFTALFEEARLHVDAYQAARDQLPGMPELDRRRFEALWHACLLEADEAHRAMDELLAEGGW